MSGGKIFLFILILGVGLGTIWGVQFYNFYAFKTVLVDQHLPKYFKHLNEIDDEQLQRIQNRIVQHSETEGYQIDVDDIKFYAVLPGGPSMSYEVYQITSDYIKRPEITIEISYIRKVLIFEKQDKVTYTKELRN